MSAELHTADAAQILAELRAVRAELAELREDQQLAARRMLAREDRADLAQLLPLVDALFGQTTWSVAGLYAETLNAPADNDLRCFLGEWVTDGGGLRSLGGLLERGRGTVHRGLRLHCVGSDRCGSLYTVVKTEQGARVSRPLKPAPVVAPCAATDDH